MKPASVFLITSLAGFLVAPSFVCAAPAPSAPTLDVQCREKAKEAAIEAFKTCLGTPPEAAGTHLQLEQIRKEYQSKLDQIRAEYETDLKRLATKKKKQKTSGVTTINILPDSSVQVDKGEASSESLKNLNQDSSQEDGAVDKIHPKEVPATPPPPSRQQVAQRATAPTLARSSGSAILFEEGMDIPEPIPVEKFGK